MKALLIDAYDSFVFIIYQYLSEIGMDTRVVRNDKVDRYRDIEQFSPDILVLGPGPGHPADAGYVDLIRQYGAEMPTFGVCLGHQAIGLAFGGQVIRADHLMHGKTSLIRHDGRGCFEHQKNSFTATRYHSLIVAEQTLPGCLRITAKSEDDGYIMGLRHKSFPIESVQFHPESIMTDTGIKIFTAFLDRHLPQSVLSAVASSAH